MSLAVENRLHFGVPIFEAQLPDFKEKQQGVLDLILSLRRQAQGVNRSNQGGWHSEENLFQHQDPLMQWLTQSLYNVGSQCIRHAEGERLQGKVLMTSMWANVNEFGAWNAPHVHLPCEWAGCVYISVNETPQQRGVGARDGDIMFFDPLPAGPQYGRPPTVSYAPKNGSLFIFPATCYTWSPRTMNRNPVFPSPLTSASAICSKAIHTKRIRMENKNESTTDI